MMEKVDVTQVLLDFDGKTELTTSLRICVACRQAVGKKKPMTLRHVLTTALNAIEENERVPFAIQMERYELAKRIENSSPVELSNAECSMLQTLVSQSYKPVVTGQVGNILEGVSAQK